MQNAKDFRSSSTRLGALLIVVALIGAQIPVAGQEYMTADNVKGKARVQYAEALSHYRMQRYSAAIEVLDKLIESKPKLVDAWLLRANVYLDTRNYAAAEADFEQAIALDRNYYWRGIYDAGRAEQMQMKYDEAIDHFELYAGNDRLKPAQRREVERELANARFAREAVKNPENFAPQPLSDSINTPALEYLPSLTADGDNLVYTVNADGQEDFYVSRRDKGVWRKGRPIAALNTRLSEGAQQISPDGRVLVYAADYGAAGLGNYDIYMSEVRQARWAKPVNLGTPVNSNAWDSQPCLAADGQTLFFASARPGGLGGRDIWMSKRGSDGIWSAPLNLGAPVNTPDDEQSPFFHPDGHTLYFMSNGHPGMGGADLFVAKIDEDGKWSEPKNLGYPINTFADEGALYVSTDGRTGYYASDKSTAQGQRLNLDIYTFEMPMAARPGPVTYVKATIFDSESRRRLEAKAEVFDVQSAVRLREIASSSNGEFLICLPAGHNYALNVSKEGYLFHSEHYALSEATSFEKPFVVEIGLTPIPEEGLLGDVLPGNKPVVLRNVFFQSGSAALRPESIAELNRLKKLLEEHSALKIRIQGHTDNQGEAADNLVLSENRAKAVYNYLVDNGIAANRLSYLGFGESQPIDTNDTPEGRQNNRRTEFVIMR